MKQLKTFMVAMLVLFVSSACSASGSDEPRIVVTSLEVANILDALAVDDVVGVSSTDAKQLPKRYQDVEQIGKTDDVDISAIEALKPTLVLGSLTNEAILAPLLVEKKIDSAFLNVSSVTGMMQSIKDLGPLLDKEKEANALVDEFKTFMKQYRETVADMERPRVLILVGSEDGYQVASEHSYVGNLVKLAGGVNVFGDEQSEALLSVSDADIQNANPTIILRMPDATSKAKDVTTMFDKAFKENEMWTNMEAIKNDKVVDLEYKIFGLTANLQYQEAMNFLKDIFYSK